MSQAEATTQLTEPQRKVLAAMWKLGPQHQHTPARLGAETGQSYQGAASVANALADKGLVARIRKEANGHVTFCLTAAGKPLGWRAHEAQAAQLARLYAEERGQR